VKVVITGIGFRSVFGDLRNTWQNILLGKTGIKIKQPFSAIAPKPLAMLTNTPMNISELIASVVTEALTDANLIPPLNNMPVVIGSSRSCQGIWENIIKNNIIKNILNDDLGELHNFPNFLPNYPAIATARMIRTEAPVLAPMAACSTGIWAIAQAVDLLKTGEYEQVICGAVESPITPLTLTGFQQMGALAETGCYPFDQGREGLVLGEGGAVFILESYQRAIARSAKIYGEILGVGLSNDACYSNAPNLAGKSAVIAIEQCLKRSGLTVNQIDCIHAHATGTKLNDQHEAQLITNIFPSNMPVIATKGSTGHTLGASGAIAIALNCLILREQVLPPCVGLRQADFPLHLIRVKQPTSIQNMLCFSFGFGGQNTVIAMGNL
jgi:3-oxoacyl-[acyl-carrier-protein] synthase II